jgi:hypothetical protein
MTTSSNRIKGQERLIELFEAEGVEVIQFGIAPSD